MTVRVLLADDQALIRSGFRALLSTATDLEVVGEAGDGNRTLEGVQATRPDVLVLDLSMPDRDGLEVIPVVRTAVPSTAIVVASGFAASRMAPLALELGACAYFEKGGPASEFRQLVKDACDLDDHASRWHRPR